MSLIGDKGPGVNPVGDVPGASSDCIGIPTDDREDVDDEVLAMMSNALGFD